MIGQNVFISKYDKIDFIDEPMQVDYDCPLDVHCRIRYSLRWTL